MYMWVCVCVCFFKEINHPEIDQLVLVASAIDIVLFLVFVDTFRSTASLSSFGSPGWIWPLFLSLSYIVSVRNARPTESDNKKQGKNNRRAFHDGRSRRALSGSKGISPLSTRRRKQSVLETRVAHFKVCVWQLPFAAVREYVNLV